MPILGALLTSLFSGMVAWLTTYVSRKIAFGVAAVAGMSGLTLGLFVVFRGLVAALASYSAGANSFFLQALGMAIPPAAPFCIAEYMTMWTACTVYTWQKDLLKIFAQS